MTQSRRLTRRHFLHASAAGLAVPAILLGDKERPKPSDRITLGFIGVGTMGRGHLGSFLGMPDVQVVAIAEVVKERREDAKKRVETHYGKDKKTAYKGCDVYNDFRDLLKRPDIDAVLIATPDHWHAIPCVLAARVKKDIYCEKPLTLTINEGKKVDEEVRKNKVVFQTGSQQRSEFGGMFCKAAAYARNGRIGTLKTIRIGVGEPARHCDLPVEDVPEGTDWEMWNGPSPKRGYNHVLCPKGIHGHFPAWRDYIEYAGGGLADMGAHHFDIAQWALGMDASGPVKIVPPTGEKDKRGLKFVYANGVEMFHGGPTDCLFEGSDGKIEVSRGHIKSDPKSIFEMPLGPKDDPLYQATNQRRNWIECIKSRKDCICPAEVGHRSASICHLANIGYQLRRALRWDPVEQKFLDDDAANKLLERTPREPWKL